MTFAPDFFPNGGEIAKNLQFWRINEEDSPKFLVDRLKIWYFAPIYGFWGKFVLVRPDLQVLDVHALGMEQHKIWVCFR